MSLTFKRLLSAILAAAMLLSLGISGFALEENEEPRPEETGASVLETEELDPASLGVQKLGQEEEELGELTPVLDPSALNELVRVSVVLNDSAALDAGYSAQNAGGYRSGLRAQQNAVERAIRAAGVGLDVEWNITLLVNAISCWVRLGDIPVIETIPGVKAVQRENQYQAQEDSAEPNTANTSKYMVGATQAWENGYTGAGSRIAIIDTGLDTTHQSFDSDAFLHAIQQVRDSGKTVNLMTTIPSGLNGAGVRISDKIPFGYNYVDRNTTIDHMSDTAGEHGSHVAGIAAANRFIPSGSEFSDAAETVSAVGMAPDAQLLVMKVFGARGGAYDSDYMVAIEDAIVMDCDSVNLSLGSAAQGFTYDNVYQDVLNKLADRTVNGKTVVTISAGNSSDLAANTYPGNLYLEDVNMHTGGTPGTFVNSLCVAAADNIGSTGAPLIFNGEQTVFYTETSSSGGTMTGIAGSYDYVYIDGKGEEAEYQKVNSTLSLRGKVVIVDRGALSFADKGNNAISYSPIAVLVANNQPGSISMDLSKYTGSFPMASIMLADAQTIKANSAEHSIGEITYYTGTVQVTATQTSGTFRSRDQAEITDFSSWGVPGSLLMKPEISAPGGSIYSVFGTNKTGSGTAGGSTSYELMSGTSMAAPHMAGLAAVLGQYLRENDLSDMNNALTGPYSTRAIAQSLLMSTATPMKPNGSYISILQQGAGLADVSAAIQASSVIMMNQAGLTTGTGAAADGKVKAELGDDPGRTGSYSYSFTVYNLSDQTLEYSLSTDLFTQGIQGEFMSRTTRPVSAAVSYTWNGASAPVSRHDVDKDGDTDADDAQAILDYLTGERSASGLNLAAAEMDRDGKLSTRDAQLLLNWKPETGDPDGYYVAPHGTASVVVSIQVTDDLSAYTKGAYIEGFTTVRCLSVTEEGESLQHSHSIPILAFWGSWTDPSMFENSTYAERLYGSEKESYTGVEDTNVVTLSVNGSKLKFSGNPYATEEVFPGDRLAMNSASVIRSVSYNLIRAAGTTGFAVSRLDDEGKVQDVLSAQVSGTNVRGFYFDSRGNLQNAGTKTYSPNLSPESLGLKEGERFRAGFYAIPEYNAMCVNDDMKNGNAGVMDADGFRTLPKQNVLGSGALMGYDFVVDNTAPQIDEPTLENSTLSVSAADNMNLAYVAVMSLDGSIVYASQTPGAPNCTVSFDASDAIANAPGYIAVFAADYAGNESARAIKVNDKQSEEKTVYILTDTISDGGEYLIVNTDRPGNAVALMRNGSLTVAGEDEVKVLTGNNSTGKNVYIDGKVVEAESVWTAGVQSSLLGTTYTFVNGKDKNGNDYHLRRTRANALYISTDGSNYWNWSWDGSRNELRNGTRYLTYEDAFTLSTGESSIYLYQKASIEIESDPFTISSVEILPGTLDLYKGNETDLSTRILPLTVEDQSVVWSSSDENVATVDETGHVIAVGVGNAVIRAAAAADPQVYGECPVQVVTISKNLNAIVWDADSNRFFSRFDSNGLPEFTRLHSEPCEQYFGSALMKDRNTLDAFTLPVSTDNGELYTINRSTFASSYVGECYVPVLDAAPAPSNYSSYLVFNYGPFLIFGNLTPTDVDEEDLQGTYCALPYGLLQMSETEFGEVEIAGVALKERNKSTASYYFLDAHGRVMETTLSVSTKEITFSDPKIVVETGVTTDSLYQSLYYDGTYLYWAHQDGEQEELIIVNPSTGAVYHVAFFGENVWPVLGLYVDGSVAPADLEEPEEPGSLGDLTPVATYSQLNTPSVRVMMTAAFARVGLELHFRDSLIEEEPAAEEKLVIEEEPATEEEPAVEEEPVVEEAATVEDGTAVEETVGETEESFGGLNAFRGSSAGARLMSARLLAVGIPSDNDQGVVTVALKESEASSNGLLTLSYDPESVSFKEISSALRFFSAHTDEQTGKVTIAYAAEEALPGESVLAQVSFRTGCEDQELRVDTSERNAQLDLSESETLSLSGQGHDWNEPEYRWAEDNSNVTAVRVCKRDSRHSESETAQTTYQVTVEPTVEGPGTGVYTAEFKNKAFATQTLPVEIPALTEPARIHGISLSLRGDIGLNIYLILPEALLKDENASVSIDGVTQPVSGAETRQVEEGVTAYRFSVNVPAKNMIDVHTVKVLRGNGESFALLSTDGSDITDTGFRYAVRNYLDQVIGDEGQPQELRDLALAMRDYGSASQAQFGYEASKRAEIGGDLSQVTAETLAAYEPGIAQNAEGIAYQGSSLLLRTETILRHYFSVDADKLSGYRFSLDGQDLTPVPVEGGCYVERANIGARDLDQAFSLTVTDPSGKTTTLRYSALSYALIVLENENSAAELKDVVRALALYHQAAEAYFTAHPQS